MPGALIHILAGIVTAFIIYSFHFKLEYAIAGFIGNLLPDAISVIAGAIKNTTLSLTKIWKSDTFMNLQYSPTSKLTTWFTLGFFIFGVGLFLYHYHIIEKKKMEEYDELYVFLIIGIVIHLILDALFIETGAWF